MNLLDCCNAGICVFIKEVFSHQPDSKHEPLIYRIDSADRLCYVNQVWHEAARQGQFDCVKAEHVLGQSLWDSVIDKNVRALYIQMIAHARLGQPVGFHYRCDTPILRRTYAMTISRLPGDEVEFASVLVRQESRPAVAILQTDHDRHEEKFIRVCSWCQSVALPSGDWVPVEDAVNKLDLMGDEKLPRLTHGICEACSLSMNQKLNALL